MKKEKKKIVILGGGFGGLYTYKGLYKYFHKDEIDITVVNKTNYFLFTPLLHEVATGGIAHHQLVESLRQIMYKTNDHLHVAELLTIDCENKKVKTTIGELSYDVLVIALGATTNFFNAPGAQEHSMVLKDLHDALKLRTTLIESFEKATEIKDERERRKELSFAVIGGGPTGVELVTEIAELINDTFLKYYHGVIKCEDISLYLINRDSEVLMPFHPSLRKGALSVIEKSGVKVMLNTGVKEVRKDSVVLNDDKVLEVNHVIWTAGVKPNAPSFSHQATLDNWGRIVVDDTLSVSGCPGVFAIGDIASLADKDGKPMPMLAQIAVKQGIHTGGNIYRFVKGSKLLPFSYQSKGALVSLGQWQALADFKFIRFSGPIAWFIWRTVYLFKFISRSKRIKIIVDWTVNIFYPRDITKA